MTAAPRCPETGKAMERDVRPLTISYRGHSLIIQMPGWYSPGSGESGHTAKDMEVSDRALVELKERARAG